jgi:hypothetical protein
MVSWADAMPEPMKRRHNPTESAVGFFIAASLAEKRASGKEIAGEQESRTPDDTERAGQISIAGPEWLHGGALNQRTVQRCNLLILGNPKSLHLEPVNVNWKDCDATVAHARVVKAKR